MTRIFISYRRVDTRGDAGRLFDRLGQRFGKGNVFMDVTGIKSGDDFYEVIEAWVASCDVLIAMIGPRWLTAADDEGRRLDNPDDFVRLEIGAALKRKIWVIPVLVGGASMPYATDLPEDLRLLTRRNALTIGDLFHPDVDRLIAELEEAFGPANPPPDVKPTSDSRPNVVTVPPGKLHKISMEEGGFQDLEPLLKQYSLEELQQRKIQGQAGPDEIADRKRTHPRRSDLPLNLTINTPIQLELILISRGKFLMGSDPDKDKYAVWEEIPQHTKDMYDYYIGKYPVTNAQYAAFVKATGHNGKWAKVGGENHPAVNVSWHDAVTFCGWLTNKTEHTFRLPTEAEWEKAGRGTDGRIYPWGNEFDEKKLNSREDGPGSATPVGQYSPKGDSPYGVADMAGNVSEWCNTMWQAQREAEWEMHAIRDNPDTTDVPRALRGGSWNSSHKDVRCTARIVSKPSYRNDSLGFRVMTRI